MQDGQKHPSFIETARRAQIIECAIETIATLGYANASLLQIAKRAKVSKSVISYYFKSKEELIDQLVSEIYTDAISFMSSQITTESTIAFMLQTYIRTNVEYIGTHPMQMLAIMEILQNSRTEDGKIRHDTIDEEPILTSLEQILRKGQQNGEFRVFDLRVMAVSIRRAIDALPPLLVVHPNLDIIFYAQELATLFDRATRGE
jgi:Transcriptional regulator